MTKIDEIISRFRNELQAAGSTFFLVYTVVNPANNEVGAKITSNSPSRSGIQAILGAILQLTESGVALLADEILGGARGGRTFLDEELTALAKQGHFLQAAKLLFENLRPHFTIRGWEQETPPKTSAPS